MNQRKRQISWLLVAALLGTAGYAYYRALARQSATLARITALDTCLAASNQWRARAAKNRVTALSEEVRKNHNRAADVAVLSQTQEIQARTKALVNTLRQLRQSWPVESRHADLKRLAAQAERYVTFIRGFVPETLPLTQPFPRLAAVGWLSEFDMAVEPKPAALALLTKLETQVRQMEAEALARQAEKVGSGCCMCFDKIGAFAVPASETVAPGAVYEAQLVLVQSASIGRMRFSADGHNIPIDPATGQGVVQFKVPAASPGQPDTVRAAWHGRVQMPWAAGDTVLETTVPFFIVKPSHR